MVPSDGAGNESESGQWWQWHHGGIGAACAALARARLRREGVAQAPELLPVREEVGGRRVRGASGPRAQHLLGALPAGARYVRACGQGLGQEVRLRMVPSPALKG